LFGSGPKPEEATKAIAKIADSRLFDAAAYGRLNNVSGTEQELIQRYVRDTDTAARSGGEAKRAAAFYDMVASSYDTLVTNHWMGPYIAFGLLYPRFRSGDAIVDLGVGTGLSAASFHRAGGRVIGLDASPEMLQKCRERGICERVVEWDLAKTPYPLEATSADHVVCSGAAHFLGDMDRFLREASRILRHDGFLYFDVMLPEAGQGITAPAGRISAAELQVHFHQHAHLLALFQQNGLKPLASFPFLSIEEIFRTDGFVGTARFGFRAYLCRKTN